MVELSDETLMAFADNVLDKAERVQIKAILEQHPELMEKVRQFERTKRPIQHAFEAVLNEPVPSALIEQVRRMPIGKSAVPIADLAAARHARTEAGRKSVGGGGLAKRGRQLSWQAMAAAASLCAVIGTGAGWSARSVVDSRQAQERVAALVQIALETVPGDSEVALPNGAAGAVRVRPAVTFQDKSHRFCRQYRLTGDAMPAAEGLACRNQTGAWLVLTQAERGKANPNLQPAGAKEGENLGSMVERIMEGDYLAADREAQLIARKWKP